METPGKPWVMTHTLLSLAFITSILDFELVEDGQDLRENMSSYGLGEHCRRERRVLTHSYEEGNDVLGTKRLVCTAYGSHLEVACVKHTAVMIINPVVPAGGRWSGFGGASVR